MSLEPPERQDIVVIGATGDLSRRKLLPALYSLAAGGLLPAGGQIVGLARSDLGHDAFRELALAMTRQLRPAGGAQ